MAIGCGVARGTVFRSCWSSPSGGSAPEGDTVDGYLASLDQPLREVAEQARKVVDSAFDGPESAMWHGHPVRSPGAAPGKQPVALIKACTRYVTFSLWRGKIDDASGKLEAGAREMAGVELWSVGDIDAGVFGEWLKQAQALEG